MRLLVDACVAGSVIHALRQAGFEAESVLEWGSDPGDLEILRRAHKAEQILLTRDKDFGELIFRDSEPHSGVVRLAGRMTYAEQAQALLGVLRNHAVALERRAFVTVDGDQVRVTPEPGDN